MERKANNSGNDVPLPAAIALGGVVLAFLFGWDSRDDLIFKAERLAQILEQNVTMAVLIGVSVGLNLVWSSLVLGRVIGLRKQGARLRRIVQDKNAKRTTGKRIVTALAYIAISFLTVWVLIPDTVLGLHEWPFSVEVRGHVYTGICLSSGMSLAIIVSLLRSIRIGGVFLKKKVVLPLMPKPVNGIVLGSIGEPTSEECA